MVESNILPFPAPTPALTVDASEVRWASGQLAALISQMDPDSPAARVLTQARRELASLTRPAAAVSTPRLRVAA